MKSSTVALVVFLALGYQPSKQGRQSEDRLWRILLGLCDLHDQERQALRQERARCRRPVSRKQLVRTALIAGDVPIGAMSGAAMATPRLQGVDLVVVLGFQNFLPFRFVVRPEIKSCGRFKGAACGRCWFWAVGGEGGSSCFGKTRVEPREGCDPFTDRRRGDSACSAGQRLDRRYGSQPHRFTKGQSKRA